MHNLNHPDPPSCSDPVTEAIQRIEAAASVDMERTLAKVRDAVVNGHSQPNRLLKIEEVAEYLGVSERTAWERVAAGEIPRVRISARVVRFTREAVDAYVRRLAADRTRP